MSAQPTPRPWASGGDEVYAGQGDTYSEVCRMNGDAPLADDNADLIVAAVTDYDRLLAVEAAARARETSEERLADFESRPVDSDFDTHEAWFAEHGHRLHNRAEAVAALRAALARPAEEERG